MNQSQHIELRLLLACFYIYLNCHTLLYIKQVFFHYLLLSPSSLSSFTYSYTYICIRGIAGSCVSVIYRFLLLYALWYKMGDLLLISIVFLMGLLCLQLIFDIYGYYSGYIQQSLYYPFHSFKTKSMTEEMIDLIFVFIKNCFGLILSIYMFIDIMNNNRRRRSTIQSIQRSSISEEDQM